MQIHYPFAKAKWPFTSIDASTEVIDILEHTYKTGDAARRRQPRPREKVSRTLGTNFKILKNTERGISTKWYFRSVDGVRLDWTDMRGVVCRYMDW